MRIITIKFSINSLVNLIDFLQMIKLLHQPISSLYLSAIFMFYHVGLPYHSLFFDFSASLSHTNLSTSALSYANFFFYSLTESLIGNHLVLKIVTGTREFMRVLILYHYWDSFLFNNFILHFRMMN